MSPAAQYMREKTNVAGISLPPRPVIYEINTRVWLRELSRRYGRPITLGDVPAEAWDELARYRFDAIWLMGVWERSQAGAALAMSDPAQQAIWGEVLPDMSEDDVAGSPYCPREYVVDAALGGPEGLAAARGELARRGLALILDFSANHIAFDHPWITSHPEYFVHGDADDLARQPEAYFAAGDHVIAHGRDPNFPPWIDSAQLNAFRPDVRAAIAQSMIDVAAQCDALCCHLAMLVTTAVFAGTWGERPGDRPRREFWREVLPRVRAAHPHVRFIAEVYWDLEWEMMQQGFDLCYDKRLYDRLVPEGAEGVRGHLLADLAYQERLVRYIENHVERRAAATFPANRALAAAVATYTLPGAKLFHQGQFEGYRTRLPLSLTRRPPEPLDRALQAFYRRLVLAIQTPALRHGQWRLCALNGWPDNFSYNNLVAWCWQAGDERRVIIVNLSTHTSQARVQLPWPELAGQSWVFQDIMEDRLFEHAGDELLNMGLFVELAPWGRHFFAIR